MTVNNVVVDNDMMEAVVAWLRQRLPDQWEVNRATRVMRTLTDGTLDAAIDLRGPNGAFATIAVETKKTFGPRGVDQLLGTLGRTLRSLAGNAPILVVAPWLSERTRGRLRDEGINYFDLTGNALLRIDQPTLFIETHGAKKDPAPQRTKANVQGPKAGRLIRTLIDTCAPYGVRELAESSGLTAGYVSRLLDTLDGEALVERSTRGRVESVDIKGCMRRWASSYDVLRSNGVVKALAPVGARQVLGRLGSLTGPTVVTGSFAAVRLAPVAGPALLMVYTDDTAQIMDELDLIPTDDGANVVLLVPLDPIVWDGTTIEDKVTYAAPSQVAIDCLTGNGRMPAEGEALLQWMLANEATWRKTKLTTSSDVAES